jgi:Methane oxygenase PmoA
MKTLACVVTAVAVLSTAPGPTASAAPPALGALTVEAGDLDRLASPVVVALPPALAGKRLELRGPGGPLPLEVATDGSGSAVDARFVLPRLGKGKRATYRIAEAAATQRTPAVEAKADADGVWLSLGGKQVLFYRAKGVAPREDVKPELVRGGYLHPVLTPAGRIVTDDYPVDHKHHHGIWNAWTSTEYEGRTPDFWNMGSKKGRKDHVAFEGSFSGDVAGGFVARLSSTDLGANPPKVVLDETWKVVLHRTHPGAGKKAPPYHLFDLETTEKLVGTSPLKLLQYVYGGLAVRGPGAWLGEKNARFLTSEGKERPEAENTTARWYFLGGDLEGKPVGFAVLGHPANFRAPAPVRIHPKEPYFSVAPPKAGPFAIEPGQPLQTRYRFVVIDGRPDKVLLDRLWNDYATPAKATADLQRGS